MDTSWEEGQEKLIRKLEKENKKLRTRNTQLLKILREISSVQLETSTNPSAQTLAYVVFLASKGLRGSTCEL